MFKKLHFKSLLLLAMMVMGAGNAWSEATTVLSWSRSGSNDTYTTGFTFVKNAEGKTGYYQDGSGTERGLMLYNTSNALFTSTNLKITFTAKLGGGSVKNPLDNSVYVCFVDKDGNTIDGTSQVVTTKITSTTGSEFSVDMSSAKATEAYGVKIYHTKESGYNVRYFSFSLEYDAVVDVTNVYLNKPSTTVYIGRTETLTATIEPSNATNKNVTWRSSNETVATVSNSGVVSALKEGSATITATSISNDSKSASCTVNVAPAPKHTANFNINGSVSSESFEEDENIEFPANPADIGGKSFVGWVNEVIEGSTNSVPDFITSATMGTTDVTYYAVFASSTSSVVEQTEKYGFEEDDNTSLWTIDGPVASTQKANTGSRSGYINTNNTYVTFNNKVKVKSFSFAFTRTSTNSNYNVYIETSSDNSTWTPVETYPMSGFTNGSFDTKSHEFDGKSELYVRFHCYNTTAVRYVDDVTITYEIAVSSYSDYCTSITVPITVTAAGYATLCAPADLDFTGLDVKAYKAIETNDGVDFEPVTEVPAGEGVLLKANEGTYAVRVIASASALTDNVFVGVANAGETINGNNGNFYVLRNASEGLGFYKVTTSAYNLKQGTAYLSLDNALAKNFIDIDNTTSIGLIGASKNDAQMFNLAGQRVGNDYKGIVIVNGKKVIR